MGFERNQLRSRVVHECKLCGMPIFKGKEYMLLVKRNPSNRKTVYPLHLHCDALFAAWESRHSNNKVIIPKGKVDEWITGRGCSACLEIDECNAYGREPYSCQYIHELFLGERMANMLKEYE